MWSSRPLKCESRTKERRGIRTAYSIDFQILHAYLFPLLQRDNQREYVSPRLVNYILKHCPARLVVSHATVYEMLSFIHRSFPWYRELRSRVRSFDPTKSSKQVFAALLDDFQSVHPIDYGADSDPDQALPILSNILSQYAYGFRRLDTLIRSKRIQPLERLTFAKDLLRSQATFRERVDGVAIGLLGMAKDPGARLRNNYIDATNIVSVCDVDQKAWLTANDSEGFEGIETVRLLTETSRLLSYRPDTIESDIWLSLIEDDVAQDHLYREQNCGRSSATARLMEVAAYTLYSELSSDLDVRKAKAEDHYRQVVGLRLWAHNAMAALNRGEPDAPECQLPASDHLRELFMPLMQQADRRSIEVYNRRSAHQPISTRRLFSKEQQASVRVASLNHPWRDIRLPKRQSRDADTEALDVYGINQNSAALDGGNVQLSYIKSNATGDRILETTKWLDSQEVSIYWDCSSDLDAFVTFLNKLISTCDDAGGFLDVEFETGGTTEENGLPANLYQRRLIETGRIRPVTIGELIRVHDSSEGPRFELPICIGVVLNGGCLYGIVCAANNTAGSSMVSGIRLRIRSRVTAALLVMPSIADTHPWSFSPMTMRMVAQALSNVLEGLK
jgi:hypothetical protein